MTVQSGRHQAAHAAGSREGSRGGASETGTERSTPAFVGRDDALNAVVDALEHRPALVLVEGEAGIGKTRLVREALTAFKGDTSAGARTSDSHRVPVAADTQRILVAACPALEEPFPLGAVVDGIRRLRPDVAELELSPLGGALRPLFPEWPDELPPALEPLGDPKETRHRVFAALTQVVERLDVEILIVEDAHWADTATLEWLLTLTAAEAGDRAMSVVVTYRPTDVPKGSLLVRLTSRAPVGRRQLRVQLEPLGITETRRLVGSMFDTGDVSAEFAEFLHERTDGVPLAVEECVRLLRDREDIVHRRGRWNRRVLDELEVPPTVRDSVLERVDRLDPRARRVLEAAAVLAAPADESLLLAVAGSDGEQAGRHAVAEALNSGLLQETDPGRFVFRHVLDSQAVGDAIVVSERRRQHRRAAQCLQQLDPQPVVRLARHCREAGDTEQWCHHAEASTDLALASGDDRAAVVTLLELLTGVEHPIDRRVRLTHKLGEAACFGASELGELAQRVVVVLRSVLASGELSRETRGELRMLLGRMLWRAGDELAALKEIEAAVPDLGHRPDLAIRAMSNLALPLIPDWPSARHLQWLERATALLPRINSPADRLAFTARRASVLLLFGEEAGWDAIGEVTEAASRLNDPRRAVDGLQDVTLASLAWGRYGDTRRLLDTTTRYIQETTGQRSLNSARFTNGYLDWYTGSWSGLRETASAAAEDEENDPVHQLQGQQLLGLLDLVSGARAVAERGLRKVTTHYYARLGIADPGTVLVSAALGRLCLADRTAEEALRTTGPVIGMIARKGVWLWATDVAPVHLEALIRRGQLDKAEAFVAEFSSGVEDRRAPAPAAGLLVCRAMLAEAREDPHRASALFAEAAEAWASLPRPYDELLALEREGRCLLAASELDQGLAVLSDAERRLTELGARWDADRVAQLLRRHGVEVARTWRRGPRGYGDQLSPRELEVVSLVARGMTNKQAAEVLFVSPKTVATQLSAAMRKLGVSSRTAVAMAAAEAGLLSPDDDSQEKG